MEEMLYFFFIFFLISELKMVFVYRILRCIFFYCLLRFISLNVKFKYLFI